MFVGTPNGRRRFTTCGMHANEVMARHPDPRYMPAVWLHYASEEHVTAWAVFAKRPFRNGRI